jgi:hypothetical protein
MSDDAAYFARRAMQERERAETAMDPAVVAAHLTLARRYEVLAAKIDSVREREVASPTPWSTVN